MRNVGVSRRFVLLSALVWVAFFALPFGNGTAARAQHLPALKSVTLSGASHVRCADSDGDPYPNPEWEVVPMGLATRPSAAVRNSSVTASLTFALDQNAPPYSGTFTPYLRMWNGVALGCSPSSQALSVSPGGTATITMTLGPLPNKVSPRKTLMMAYRITDPMNPGSEPGSGWAVPLYLIHAKSTFPQETPWEGVLDDACAWAEDENTDSGVAEATTYGLFFSGIAAYNMTPPHRSGYSPSAIGGPYNNFRLADFLFDAFWTPPAIVNCHDVSNYISICMNALGLTSFVSYIENSPQASYQTNFLHPIGNDPYFNSPIQIFWSNHQLTTITQTTIYDACLALETDPNGVVQGLNAEPAYNVLLTKYWQNRIGTVAHGMVWFTRQILLRRTTLTPQSLSSSDGRETVHRIRTNVSHNDSSNHEHRLVHHQYQSGTTVTPANGGTIGGVADDA